MEPSPEPRETISRFEKLLAALVTNRVDFAVAGGLAVMFKAPETGGGRIPYLSPADLILLKQDSWREKGELDVLALSEILGPESPPGDQYPQFRGGRGRNHRPPFFLRRLRRYQAIEHAPIGWIDGHDDEISGFRAWAHPPNCYSAQR
jgi:hypothetical protein